MKVFEALILTFAKDDQLVRAGSQITGIEMGVSMAGGLGKF
jgi:MFS family permease